MTDNNDPKPTKKTSAVPLRKETVRVTLKATPDTGGDDSAKGPPPAPAPTVPLKLQGTGAPSVPSPAPTVKLQTGAPTTPSPSTVPLPTGTQAQTPEPAPTVKLSTPGTSSPAGAISQPLPKASVQLQKGSPETVATAPAEGASQAPTIVTTPGDITAEKEAGPAPVLSIIAMVAALIVLGVQLGTANIWVNDETQENPGWGKLFE